MAILSQFLLSPKTLSEKIGEEGQRVPVSEFDLQNYLFVYFRILNIEYCSMCLKYYFCQG